METNLVYMNLYAAPQFSWPCVFLDASLSLATALQLAQTDFYFYLFYLFI